MISIRSSSRLALGLAVSVLAFAPPAAAQSPAESFHKAYYLQHESGDLKAALALYRKVAENRRAPAELRQQAVTAAREVQEELACTDFARLMPGDAIFYLEFNRPGEQLRSLLGQLGLLGAGGDRYGVSPALIEGALGMRGAAVAITEIDPRNGPQSGVAIFHPGDLAVVRGLLETALPVGGTPEEPIGDYATYSIEGEAFVTLTSRLLIAGRHREDIAGVLARMRDGGEGSLAQNPHMGGAMAMRGSDLMFFCLNLEPVMPMVLDAIRQEARRDPGLAAAMAFVDLPSARTIVGRAGVDGDGMSFDMIVELDEGHRSLAFNLMRMPNLDEQALALVPAGPAFFCVGAVNSQGQIPPGLTDAKGRPVVTLMDLGRELFANIGDVALFVMPDVQRAPWGPMPDVGIALRVNDPERSMALWQLLLGSAQMATGGKPAAAERRGDVLVQRFAIENVPLFLAQTGDHLVLTPSERLVDTAVEAVRSGRSVLRDPLYAHALEQVGRGSTMVAAANLGRCGAIGRHFMSDREQREAAPFLELLQDTTMSLAVMQTANRLGAHGCVVGIPDVGPMLSELIEREVHRGRRPRAARPQRSLNGSASRSGTIPPPPTPPEALEIAEAVERAVVGATELREHFEQAHEAGHFDAARKVAGAIGATAQGQPTVLNDFAWALLTEERYGNRYDEVALRLAKIANEASAWSNWYHLDTYARALFRAGSVDEAIEIQIKAIEVGEGDPRIGEARKSLEQYVEAAKKRRIREP